MSARPSWKARLGSVDDQFRTPVERSQRDSDGAWRRRRIISAVTIVAGAVCLALMLRMPRDSPWFPAAALGVAAIWAIGGFAAGPLHLGRLKIEGTLVRPIIAPILAGLALAGVFVLGALLTRLVPALAEQVQSVLGFADQGSLPILAVTTAVSGVAEEIFFRGAVYASVREGRQIWVTTLLYAATTALSGNVMLAFAAILLGVVTGVQRRVTGGILAPILTHVTWSMAMLFLLPLIF